VGEIATDPDGCFRRRCRVCRKHFATSLDERARPNARLWCPYCGAERAWDCWVTPAQQNYLENVAAENAFAMVGPDVDDALIELARSSAGVIEYRPIGTRPPRAPFFESTSGLLVVSTPCHPDDKLKVEASWLKPVRCHLCGTAVSGLDTKDKSALKA